MSDNLNFKRMFGRLISEQQVSSTRLLEKDELEILSKVKLPFDVDLEIRRLWGQSQYKRSPQIISSNSPRIYAILLSTGTFLPYFFQGQWITNILTSVVLIEIIASIILVPTMIVALSSETVKNQALDPPRLAALYKKPGLMTKLDSGIYFILSMTIPANLIIQGWIVSGIVILIADAMIRFLSNLFLDQTKEALEKIKIQKRQEVLGDIIEI